MWESIARVQNNWREPRVEMTRLKWSMSGGGEGKGKGIRKRGN